MRNVVLIRHQQSSTPHWFVRWGLRKTSKGYTISSQYEISISLYVDMHVFSIERLFTFTSYKLLQFYMFIFESQYLPMDIMHVILCLTFFHSILLGVLNLRSSSVCRKMRSATARTLRAMRCCVCVPMALLFSHLELISGT